MKFAYADPPYIGCAHLYPEKREVDHVALIAQLVDEFPDGWALSCHSPSLRTLLPLCPEDVRVMAWVKGWCAMRKSVRPQYAWEPVIMRGGRRIESGGFTCIRDWLQENVTLRRTVKGAKPDAFNRWILDCLGYQDGDEFVDLFPGSGTMADALRQMRLA